MPLKDKISLNPLDKYTIYNRFPYKLVLHVILVLILTILVSTIVSHSQSQLRGQQYVWYSKFILNNQGEDVPVSDDFNRAKRYFSVVDLLAHINRSLNNYYDMKDNPDNDFEDYAISNNA
jgi:hypothetical protein